jgi:hypothetical protein
MVHDGSCNYPCPGNSAEICGQLLPQGGSGNSLIWSMFEKV